MKDTPAQYLALWAIISDEQLSASAKCVATVLLLKFRNHKTNQCNPGFSTLAKCVGRKRRSVIDALNELKAAGWIDWEGTKGGSPANTNHYQFFLKPRPVQQTAPVQPNAPTGAVECTKPVQHTAHELSIEPSERPKPLSAKQGVKVRHGSPEADQWRRYWAARGDLRSLVIAASGTIGISVPLTSRSAFPEAGADSVERKAGVTHDLKPALATVEAYRYKYPEAKACRAAHYDHSRSVYCHRSAVGWAFAEIARRILASYNGGSDGHTNRDGPHRRYPAQFRCE
jgi:hypothetical protein